MVLFLQPSAIFSRLKTVQSLIQTRRSVPVFYVSSLRAKVNLYVLLFTLLDLVTVKCCGFFMRFSLQCVFEPP